jgi:hypothetical protein
MAEPEEMQRVRWNPWSMSRADRSSGRKKFCDSPIMFPESFPIGATRRYIFSLKPLSGTCSSVPGPFERRLAMRIFRTVMTIALGVAIAALLVFETSHYLVLVLLDIDDRVPGHLRGDALAALGEFSAWSLVMCDDSRELHACRSPAHRFRRGADRRGGRPVLGFPIRGIPPPSSAVLTNRCRTCTQSNHVGTH